MGLEFYNSNRIMIIDGEGQVITSHDGVSGESVEMLVYLRNDTTQRYYTNIQVWPYDTETPDDTLGIYGTGWGVKLSAGARQPTPAEWDNILAGDTINMPNIGSSERANTTDYYPFWVKITSPGNLPAQTKESIQLRYRSVSHVIGS